MWQKVKRKKKFIFSKKQLSKLGVNEWSFRSKLVGAFCLPSSQSARTLWRDVLVSTQRSVLPWNKCGGTHGWIQALCSYSHSVANHRCTEYLQWNQVLAFSPRWHKTLQPTNGCFTYAGVFFMHVTDGRRLPDGFTCRHSRLWGCAVGETIRWVSGHRRGAETLVNCWLFW